MLSLVRRALAALEPWYDWGPYSCLGLDDTSFDGRFFTVEWFGVHLSIQIGRLPREGGSS